jgi:hypothetical protein
MDEVDLGRKDLVRIADLKEALNVTYIKGLTA